VHNFVSFEQVTVTTGEFRRRAVSGDNMISFFFCKGSPSTYTEPFHRKLLTARRSPLTFKPPHFTSRR
jgi:hypothetical protein